MTLALCLAVAVGLGLWAALVYGVFHSWLVIDALHAELAEARGDLEAAQSLLGLAERRVSLLQGQVRDLWRANQAARSLPADVLKRSFRPATLTLNGVRRPTTPTYRAWLACNECGGNGCSACRGVA